MVGKRALWGFNAWAARFPTGFSHALLEQQTISQT